VRTGNALSGVDEMVLSHDAKGLTARGITAVTPGVPQSVAVAVEGD
jgi:hypothetical protein